MDRLLKIEEQYKKAKLKIPKVEVEFIRHSEITNKFQPSILSMKKHFNNWDREYEVRGDIDLS